RNEVARQTPPRSKCRFPARPKGDFRGKAPSAYSELRFKLKLNVRKTIRRPRTAEKKAQFRSFLAQRGDGFLVTMQLGSLDQVSGGKHQFFRRSKSHLLIPNQTADSLTQPARNLAGRLRAVFIA